MTIKPHVPINKTNHNLESLRDSSNPSLLGEVEAIKRVRILYLPIATLVTLARNDTWNLVMLSEAKHLFGFQAVSILFDWHIFLVILFSFFSLRGTGGLIACAPYYMILIANALHLLLVCRFAPNVA